MNDLPSWLFVDSVSSQIYTPTAQWNGATGKGRGRDAQLTPHQNEVKLFTHKNLHTKY